MAGKPKYAAIEAGGTKWRVAIGRSAVPETITTIPTSDPVTTLSACVDFIKGSGVTIDGVAIASFGPFDLDPESPTYGFILDTPKPGWTNTDIKGVFERRLDTPAVIDIDVAAAALGEWQWGAGRGSDPIIYITVGTGIGAAALRKGRTMHERRHAEMGHIVVNREADDPFEGTCPFHGDCLEGLAAGPALHARWGRPGPELVGRPEVWDLESRYLAQALQTFVYALAPDRIVIGGGVLQQPGLLDLIRERLTDRLAGYGPVPGSIDDFVVLPEFGQDAGLVGAFAMARRHFEEP